MTTLTTNTSYKPLATLSLNTLLHAVSDKEYLLDAFHSLPFSSTNRKCTIGYNEKHLVHPANSVKLHILLCTHIDIALLSRSNYWLLNQPVTKEIYTKALLTLKA